MVSVSLRGINVPVGLVGHPREPVHLPRPGPPVSVTRESTSQLLHLQPNLHPTEALASGSFGTESANLVVKWSNWQENLRMDFFGSFQFSFQGTELAANFNLAYICLFGEVTWSPNFRIIFGCALRKARSWGGITLRLIS